MRVLRDDNLAAIAEQVKGGHNGQDKVEEEEDEQVHAMTMDEVTGSTRSNKEATPRRLAPLQRSSTTTTTSQPMATPSTIIKAPSMMASGATDMA